MTKLVGITLIIASSISLGFLPIHRLQLQKNILFAFSCMLQSMSAVLSSTMCSIPQLLSSLQGPAPLNPFLDSLSTEIYQFGYANIDEAWSQAVQCNSVNLSQEDCAELVQLGQILGRQPIDEQIEYLHQVSDYFYQRHRELYLAIRERTKIYISSGFSLGLMLIIILL